MLAALLPLAACRPAEEAEHTPFDELAEAEAAPGEPEAAGADSADRADAFSDPPALAAVRSVPVIGRTGPGGEPFEVVVREPGRAGQDRWFGRRTFPIALRSDQPVAAPCSSCHRPGQAALRPEGRQNAHRNFLPRHPDRGGSQCRTCHAVGNVEQLQLIDGTRVPLAHAYALCGQCHYLQVDAWAAGVHGKRLDAWRGRRVVLGCADCHDPHQPAVQPRNPYPGPTLPGTDLRAPHEP
ncbi:MAG: hypothetical protein ACYC6F_17065 [Longimicrobiales bacterium]